MYTVLDYVQKILSSTDSEEVNSISDTVESMQVAEILEDCFYEIITDLQLPVIEGLFQLDASLDINLPCVMYIPENIKKIDWVKYNAKDEDDDTLDNYKTVKRISVADLVQMTQGLRNNDYASSQSVLGPLNEHMTFYYRIDKTPQYYAALNNRTLVFDSYQKDVDSTLQKSKTMVQGSYYPVFLKQDSFVPPINNNQMMMLLNLAKERAFNELKQMENTNARRAYRRQLIASQRIASKNEDAPGIIFAPRYGKRG